MELGNVFIDPLPEEGRKQIPGILLNTLPKSASVYLWNALSTGLAYPQDARFRRLVACRSRCTRIA